MKEKTKRALGLLAWVALGLGQVRGMRQSRVAHATLFHLQLFANDVLELFCLDCRRVSTEVFGQAMPLGKYWRLALQAGTREWKVAVD